MIDTAWWEQQDAASFLSFNWSHPSRAWATEQALTLAMAHGGGILEVGPGSGVDYARAFRAPVIKGDITYTAYEPTRAFHVALQAAYPEAVWVNAPCYDLAPRSASVIYARAVLEHQSALRPALDCLLLAARHAVVIDWYRPPADVASCDVVGGVPCHTYARADVLRVLALHNATVSTTHAVDGNDVWLITVTP